MPEKTTYWTVHTYTLEEGRKLVHGTWDYGEHEKVVKEHRGRNFLSSSYSFSDGGLDVRRYRYYEEGDPLAKHKERNMNRVNLTREDLEFLMREWFSRHHVPSGSQTPEISGPVPELT